MSRMTVPTTLYKLQGHMLKGDDDSLRKALALVQKIQNHIIDLLIGAGNDVDGDDVEVES